MQDFYPSRNCAHARRLPRIDPVVYGKWDAAAPLTLEQTYHFDTKGYVVLENVFSRDEVKLLQAEAGRLLGDPASLEPETVVVEPGSEEVRSVFRIHAQCRLIAGLAADERLGSVARFLLDDEIYIHQSRLNYKPGFYGKEFHWHSDFETWHVEDGMPRMRALSMSILLTENTPHNGPLMLIPGSHRCFLSCVGETPADHYRSSLKRQEFGVPDHADLTELVRDHGIDAPIGEAGTVIVFDCNTIHGSNGNITPLPRTNAFLVYNAMSNRLVEPFGRTAPRPEFIAARDPAPLYPAKGPLMEEAI